ncbi:MAG: hypothetical protein ACJ72E_09795 [Marmoricola sp.]
MNTDRLDADSFDASLSLLDRQVVDVEGLAVCKVDDLEISFYDDGSDPAVTRILTGPAALEPRMSTRTGHWLRGYWKSLGIQYADRDVPLAVELGDIARVGSAVELSVEREGLLDRQPPPVEGVTLRRMGELIGSSVTGDGRGHPKEKVLDVRLLPGDERYVIDALLVGPGRPGSLLGYDRGDFNGPALVNAVVGWLHRHSREVPWSDVEDVDWEAGTVRVRMDRAAAGHSS